eukprot:TRINITY_DN929_c0_g1_i1.p1 TRINITY_DN929_c0_g1~~TRINITY_DN929_c0_g1_i1.p1  ORF type:complete len:123 (-),score=12.09 TRINITY_DN929_c0_g1_i1:47-394(-)
MSSCHRCKKKIETLDKVKADGHEFHEGCFTCFDCGSPLEAYVEIDGKEICDACVDKRNPPCPNCHKPLAGAVVEALGKTWHVGCLTCSKCHATLATESAGKIAQKAGKLLCSKCV